MKIKKFLEHLKFVPWYLFQTKVLHNDINLERLYKGGYCVCIRVVIALKDNMDF